MTSFAEVVARTAKRKVGEAALERILATTAPRSPGEIAPTPDDRILAEMTRRISYAGFSSKVIDDKWTAFESGLDGFDPATISRILVMSADLPETAFSRHGTGRPPA